MISRTIIKIEDLAKWRKDNPNEKKVLVEYSTGISELWFNYINPSTDLNVWKHGTYDAFGNCYFIDEEGTRHKMFSKKK